MRNIHSYGFLAGLVVMLLLAGTSRGFAHFQECEHNCGDNNPPTHVPEPASMLLLGVGMAGVLAARRARRG